MARSRSRSRRQEAIHRRRRRKQRTRWIMIGVGILLLGLIAWGVIAAVQRAALARAIEAQPPVVGTPLAGGMDMSFVRPTAASLPQGDRPKIVIPRDRYAFGVLSVYGAPAEHTFRVFNDGQADLEISAVNTSCGCTTARLSAQRIPPGESAELVVRFDPAFHGQAGDFDRYIYLYSNDPRNPEVLVTISAQVR